MAEYQVALREGIVGGFAGPIVKQVVNIQGDNSGAKIMHALLEPENGDFNTLVGDASSDQLSTLLERLKKELRDLPTEDPVGSEDIYGQDISLSFFSDDFQWSNGGPEGCSQGKSTQQATPEQKEKFKELVDLVKGFGQEYAVTTADNVA